MEIFIHIITHNIIPIFILIGTGFLIGHKFKMDVATLSKMNFYAFMPFFVFVIIYTNDLAMNMGKTLLFAAIFMAANTGLAYATAGIRRMGKMKTLALVNSTIFYNCGNIGIPLITLIFSGTPYLSQALIVQVTIMLTQSLTINTIGFYNASRGKMHWKQSLLVVLKMPTVYSIIAAIVLKQINLDLETSFVWPAFIYLKEAMIGFVLVTLGVQLSQTKLTAGDPDVLLSILLRLVGGPLIALLILKLGKYEGILGQVLFISSSAPTAVNAALIAIEHNAEPEFIAKNAAFSTFLCSITYVFVVYFSGILFLEG